MSVELGNSPIAHAWINLGMSADDVAEAVGVHRSFVYDVAKGIKRPSLKTAFRFSKVLETPVEELFPDIFLSA